MQPAGTGGPPPDLKLRSLGYVGAVKALCGLLGDQYLAAGELAGWRDPGGRPSAARAVWRRTRTCARALPASSLQQACCAGMGAQVLVYDLCAARLCVVHTAFPSGQHVHGLCAAPGAASRPDSTMLIVHGGRELQVQGTSPCTGSLLCGVCPYADVGCSSKRTARMTLTQAPR